MALKEGIVDLESVIDVNQSFCLNQADAHTLRHALFVNDGREDGARFAIARRGPPQTPVEAALTPIAEKGTGFPVANDAQVSTE
jgi:hypothetical protein